MAVVFLSLFTSGFTQVVDCILAEVNTQAITLTDVKILQAFAIGERGVRDDAASSLRQILERAIDRKVVIGLVRANITVTKEEVDDLLNKVLEQFEPAERQRKLFGFGLQAEDMRPYLEEKLLYEKIIAIRFSQGVEVSLKEIETYYNEVYLPSEKAQGSEPKPMIQVLDEIESQIKKEKTEQQVASWMSSLRNQAEIRINSGCLEQIK